MEEQNLNLEELKQEAQELGIEFSHKIGAEALKARIDAYKVDSEEIPVVVEPVSQSKAENPIIAKIAKMSLRDDKTAGVYEPTKNVRVKITCLDPDKTAWQGEIICAGNAKVSIRKYILFDKEYHVPQALLDVLKEKTYTKFITTKNKLGHDVTKTVQSPSYNIEYLSAITQEEVEAIKQNQLINKD